MLPSGARGPPSGVTNRAWSTDESGTRAPSFSAPTRDIGLTFDEDSDGNRR